jgi:hypothetical protein
LAISFLGIHQWKIVCSAQQYFEILISTRWRIKVFGKAFSTKAQAELICWKELYCTLREDGKLANMQGLLSSFDYYTCKFSSILKLERKEDYFLIRIE